MFIKENVYRLLTVLLIIIFAAGLFFTVKFLKKKASQATNPSQAVISANEFNFDPKTLDAVLKKVQ